MKTLSLFIVLLASTFLSNAQDITVTVDNVLNDQGTVLISLHDTNTFMKGKGILSGEIKATKGKVTYIFKDVKPGTYAIMVLHDKNDNKQMDFADSGMPMEAYGVSNNPMAFGPPQFTEAKFEFTDESRALKIMF
jgi:uncharacterized protein (DUF2141 family)